MLFFFFVYLGFLSRPFTIQREAGEGRGYLFNSSLPLPPASQILRNWPSDYWRELTSAHRQQLDSYQQLLVSKRKFPITKLRVQKKLMVKNLKFRKQANNCHFGKFLMVTKPLRPSFCSQRPPCKCILFLLKFIFQVSHSFKIFGKIVSLLWNDHHDFM